jgi:hypothetical protein
MWYLLVTEGYSEKVKRNAAKTTIKPKQRNQTNYLIKKQIFLPT